MAGGDTKKSGKMTVFRSDRHEDWAAMIFVALLTGSVLLYMSFIKPDVAISAPSDGKLVSVAVQPGAEVKRGDVIYTLETKEKKYVENKLQEKVVQKEIKSKAEGKVTQVVAKPGDAVKKDKTTILVLDHKKGTLP